MKHLNQIRIIWAACRTVWFYQHLGQEPLKLNWLRPWQKKSKPFQRDIAFELRNELIVARLCPYLSWVVDKSLAKLEHAYARAA
ncbi:MAG: hypothetical protein R3B47_13320 [Bacteroidia bacterium]